MRSPRVPGDMPAKRTGVAVTSAAKRRPQSWSMRLTQADLDAMPAELRRQLLRYLGQTRSLWPRATAVTGAAALDRRQVTALLRDISFHPKGKALRALLDRLADGDTARQKLAAALQAGERARLGGYIALLNRLAARAARQRALRLCRFVRGDKAYVIHPATRQHLRDLLPGIEHAGEQEEPLWE